MYENCPSNQIVGTDLTDEAKVVLDIPWDEE
jgi:hypothetical protein